ncbi:MAG: hypothetical protein M3179_09085 [Actinomycetota bacterium]|nr:hypothetical protein [Actinomycetota bacterium]
MSFVSSVQSKLTYPNVGVTLCLLMLLALLGAGQAYAVNTIRSEDVVDGSLTGADLEDRSIGLEDLATDSVGARALKFGHVITQHLRDGAVTGSKVANGTLEGRDIRDKSVTEADIDYGFRLVTAAHRIVTPGTVDSEFVSCGGDTRPIAGGFQGEQSPYLRPLESYPVSNGWIVTMQNTAPDNRYYTAYAICAKLGELSQVFE